VFLAWCCSISTEGFRPAAAPAGPMDDATITARVKTVLLNDAQVTGTGIEVATTGGIVTISGTVKNPTEAARAIELARSVTGVRDVKSALQVAP
jgi:hyperosmotically inducible periplasmic protein